MPDLEIGEKVTVIKNVDGNSMDLVGWTGIVDRKASGGYFIKFGHVFLGSFEICVGIIDWPDFVKKVVIKDPTPSPVPKSLQKWHAQTLKTVKNG